MFSRYLNNDLAMLRYLENILNNVMEETVDRVHESFSRSPHKSTMLINTWQELEYRLDICQETTGAHIEVCGHA
jgi:hypothetical protein